MCYEGEGEEELETDGAEEAKGERGRGGGPGEGKGMKEGVPSDRSWGSEEQRESLCDGRGN